MSPPHVALFVTCLVDVMHYTPTPPPLNTTAINHDSCAGLRELGVKTQPRQNAQTHLRHIAEVLAPTPTGIPAIGQSSPHS
ncbi:hypothetical protein [Acidocella sp.]|uniref:hypothetical protein n=1 Tax=Acidocella sp. TaxID=50710 RepID=UPI00262ABF49|nr:hypothetical protein [Acidocella sp.]MDD2795981.1 hypothetical protein [Acidocella sp.]